MNESLLILYENKASPYFVYEYVPTSVGKVLKKRLVRVLPQTVLERSYVKYIAVVLSCVYYYYFLFIYYYILGGVFFFVHCEPE